jgi:hypothetical protein
MLRQKDIIKYKTKSKFDHILFLRKDAEYLLRNNRPIKDNLVPSLNDVKVHLFIEDILTNKKISELLFAKNSKFEIKTYLNIKKRFFTHKNPPKKKRNTEDNITTKLIKKETKIKLKNEINLYKRNKEQMRNSMDKINDFKIAKFKKELNMLGKEHTKEMKRYKINGFMRAYSALKSKYDMTRNKSIKNNKNNSCVLNNKYYYRNRKAKNNIKTPKSLSNETNETESKIKYKSNSLIFSYKNNEKKPTFKMPKVKLNIKDVFNRLYHNVVLLSPSSSIKVKKRPQSCKNPVPYSSQTLNINNNNNKIKFHLKKVIKSTSGKEFTFKITQDIIQKCFIKYSGGPTVLTMNKDRNKNDENENQDNNIPNNNDNINEELEEEINLGKKQENYVNYYKLIDKKTGNSFLHLAVIGGYAEFLKYFLEKKSDINLRNFDGNTPLHLALFNKDKNIIDILMNNKPKLDIPNNNGQIQFDLFTDEMKEYYGIDKMLIINRNRK